MRNSSNELGYFARQAATGSTKIGPHITTINRVNLTTMTRLIALLVAVAANEISSSPARARGAKTQNQFEGAFGLCASARRPAPETAPIVNQSLRASMASGLTKRAGDSSRRGARLSQVRARPLLPSVRASHLWPR